MKRFVAAATYLAVFWFVLMTTSVPAGAEPSYELRWRVPERTCLVYGSGKAQQAQARAQRKISEKLVQLVPAPTGGFQMFGYEIAAADRREQGTGVLNEGNYPLSMEDLLLQLAMFVPGKPMRTGEKYQRKWNFSRVEGLSPLNIESTYEAVSVVDVSGAPCIEIKSTHVLADVPPEPDAGTPSCVWRQFDVACLAHFNHQQGRLEGARFEVRGASLEVTAGPQPKRHVNYYDWDLEWKFERAFDSTVEADLKRYVDLAIVRGRERLQEMQDAEGCWPYGPLKRGGTALAILALLVCGVPADNTRIVAGFEAMKAQPLDNTYEVATSLMAYEAKYISDEEKRAFLEGRKVETRRNLSTEDRKEMQRLLDWIAQNQNRINPFWVYKYSAGGVAEGYDLSNTQYALLALGTGQRCGLQMPRGFLRKFGDELRALQESDGPEVKRVIGAEPPRPLRSGQTASPQEREPRFTRAAKSVKARGWRYALQAEYDPKTRMSGAWGSMTCSGISCLSIAMDMAAQLSEEDRRTEFGTILNYKTWVQAGVASLESALAWMEVHFSATRNANLGRLWHYYYLYGMERVGVLCNIRYMGEHDWYAEGASLLICRQRQTRDWEGTAVDTSFALLFLKRGTVPPKTSPLTGNGADVAPKER